MSELTIPAHLACLHDVLISVDAAPVECDGHTLMVSNALCKAGIPHERVIGSVSGQAGRFTLMPHLWINIDGFILDYRLRMWVCILSGPDLAADAPHGIFPVSAGDCGYQYIETGKSPVSNIDMRILNLMTNGFAGKLQIPEKISKYYLEK
ncbi:TPA: hypothetical protein ACK1K0_004446 [Klebsiella pneumoniae]